MLNFYDIIEQRRDTRHFSSENVPDEVIKKALHAGHHAPSVGLTDATKYYLIRSEAVKQAIKSLFEKSNKKASDNIVNEKQKVLYASLKLEAIIEAPLGLLICYDRSVLNDFTIGTIATNETLKFSSVCSVENIWLSLTEQGYSMGWVSILDYYNFKKIMGLPEEIEPLGYFCIGKPATNYNHQPMLQQQGWKNKSTEPCINEINSIAEIPSLAPINENGLLNQNKNDILSKELQTAIDEKTKPQGSLGVLETISLQIGQILNTQKPEILHPHIAVFAADHGIAAHGVSAYPMDVTRQMVDNFLRGGAAINVFCRQHDIQLSIIDAGVNYDFPSNTPIINTKIGKGTRSFLNGPAMSKEEMLLCFDKGKVVVKEIVNTGANTIGFGEMGIGNTATAAVLMSLLCNYPLEDCVGKGTGVNDERYHHKLNVLKKAIENYTGTNTLYEVLAYFGGFEILQMAGGILEAYANNMVILIDGFISTVSFLIAQKINPSVKQNAIFCHCSEEKGHRLLLDYLKAKEILQLHMRLGEGTGCAIAFPILQSAVLFLNEMASFESAGVSNKEEKKSF